MLKQNRRTEQDAMLDAEDKLTVDKLRALRIPLRNQGSQSSLDSAVR